MADPDNGYRLLFSHPRMVEELLRGFVREPWVECLDFAYLERVSGSFVSRDLRSRHNDVVWKLGWREERGTVYLLVEFQSRPDRFMALRLLTYLALLYEDRVRNKDLTPAGKLPPVLLLVLYNGNRPWTAPRDLDALVEPAPGALEQSRPRLRYVVVDERRVDPGTLDRVSDLMAILVRIETASSPEELIRLALLLPAVVPEPDLRQAFAVWLSRVMWRSFPSFGAPDLESLEEVSMLEENLIAWRKRKEREDKAKGMRGILLLQLDQRFGPLSGTVRRNLSAIRSKARLERLAEQILTANSLRDLGLE
ncbi:MAG TPA: Rpn family recombination-promoting nuclease/putative transposase [Thermoanaerobaculia bacterium]|nr:Rpn family recombination-promoting nuclease/putative transposase [Thermoanaerobaculia bacterium]